MRSGKVEKTLMAITWLLFISQINIVWPFCVNLKFDFT
jgi:hypothetical protein